MADISLKSPAIIEFGSFHMTNAVLSGLLTSLILIAVIVFVVRGAKLLPTRSQSMMEIIVVMFKDFLVSAYGSEKRAVKYLPFFITLFLFLLLANQFSLIPLVNSIVAGDGDLLFRISTADYSQTISLAILAIGGAHLMAFTIAPMRHIGNFIKIAPLFKARSFGDFANAILDLFLGILDIIGEFAKFVSISARLFGNIFAGEVMVVVIAAITSWTAYVLPVPFLALGIFSGLVQAYVFTILALQFMTGTITAVDAPTEEAVA